MAFARSLCLILAVFCIVIQSTWSQEPDVPVPVAPAHAATLYVLKLLQLDTFLLLHVFFPLTFQPFTSQTPVYRLFYANHQLYNRTEKKDVSGRPIRVCRFRSAGNPFNQQEYLRRLGRNRHIEQHLSIQRVLFELYWGRRHGSELQPQKYRATDVRRGYWQLYY